MRVAGLVVAALLVVFGASAAAAPVDRSFHFQVSQGPYLNYFLRDGDVTAHVVLRSGSEPRLVVAFPAGNSGDGLWFEPGPGTAQWQLETAPRAATGTDAHGRRLYGTQFEASIPVASLTPHQAVLSNIRVLRDYDQYREKYAPVLSQVTAPMTASPNTLSWARDRLDGAPGYQLRLHVVDGTVTGGRSLAAGSDGRIRVRVTALTGDAPLTPLSGKALLDGNTAALPSARDTLTFLSYREKFLGGSWHFDTYFGRDTLISMMLLMPVLAPDATESGLRSVLARLDAQGQVAHEESLSEYAVMQHRREGINSDAPIFDYNMIDENYLLAPMAARYLLDDARGAARAAGYVHQPTASGGAGSAQVTNGQALVRNLRLVVSTAAAFAHDPRWENLVRLRDGAKAGEWRDSDTGIGGGRYPYDVDAILVPAALDATARLVGSGALDSVLTAEDRAALSAAAGEAQVWHQRVRPLFAVTVDAAHARSAIEAYAAKVGVPAQPALAALNGPVVFPAVALDAAGKPIPVLHSDDSFDMLYGNPAPDVLDREVTAMTRPFPLGLQTGAGLVVANPAFASAGLQAQFTSHDYHGTVVWSWVQAMLASGMHKQLQRNDLPQPVRDRLQAAQRTVWQGIDAASAMRDSELWSWRYDNGYHATAFGADRADAAEADAAQLWSTVYLAVRPPS